MTIALLYWWHWRKIKKRIVACLARFKRISFLDFKENWNSLELGIPYSEKHLRKILDELILEKTIRIDSYISNQDDTEYVYLKTENLYNLHFYGKQL